MPATTLRFWKLVLTTGRAMRQSTGMDKLIPVLSLLVAAFAVFVGPLISLRVARRQVMSSLEVANKQITAPMRQAWINNLRDLLAEITSSALHYFVAGFEDRTDEEYRRLLLLEDKIQMMLNPKEGDHKRLEQLIRTLISGLQRGERADGAFEVTLPAVKQLSREVLKREWDRVKGPIGIDKKQIITR